MVAFPLLILALAAGIYLLMKATREYLAGFYKALAWLVIILSLGAILAMAVHGIHHFRHRHDHPNGMMREERMMIHQQADNGAGHICPMGNGCKMAGDSVVLDKTVCEKLIGKDSCDKLCALRGQCILSKDECAKMCSAAGNPHCMMKGGEEGNACCMKGGKQDGMKDCCKKK